MRLPTQTYACEHSLTNPEALGKKDNALLWHGDAGGYSRRIRDRLHRVGRRWKVEELQREMERCQCRKARAQRNHIACVNLAWVILKRAAYALKMT
jgi:hypothetical protein